MSYITKPKNIYYLTYDGSSGTSSGTDGCILTSPGNWTVKNFDSVYYADTSSGNITITIPDSSTDNQGKSLIISKPLITSLANTINVKTISNQTIIASSSSGLYLIKPDDKFELMTTKFGVGGSTEYRWRRINEYYTEIDRYTVGPYNCNYSSIKAAIDSLNANAIRDSVIQILPGKYDITDTVTINCPYQLILQGDLWTTTFNASIGLSNKPMFLIKSSVDFNTISFNGYNLINYGNNPSENCLQYEINTASSYSGLFNIYMAGGFYNGIFINNCSTNTWIFNSEIDYCTSVGIYGVGGSIETSECTYTNNNIGIYAKKGNRMNFSVQNCRIQVGNSQYGIAYDASNFINYNSFVISNNVFKTDPSGNNLLGFDFSKQYNADMLMYPNGGMPRYSTFGYLSFVNNASTTTVNVTPAKALGVNSSRSYGIKMGISDNRLTYFQSTQGFLKFSASGSIQSNSTNKTGTIYIIKNGSTGNPIAQTQVRFTSGGQSFTFGINGADNNVMKNDYYEIYLADSTGSQTYKLLDLQFVAFE